MTANPAARKLGLANGQDRQVLVQTGPDLSAEGVLLRSWQAFLLRVHRQAGGHPKDAEPLAALAAGLLLAIEAGDVCLAPEVPVPASPVITLIGSEGASVQSGVPEPTTPLVYDGGFLYLQRMWVAERQVVRRILELNQRSPQTRGAIPDALSEALSDEQAAALRIALQRSLLLLTGGPGTGKTFTLARILVALSTIAPSLNIAIAAPTGKAAARLAQALASLQPDRSWTVQTVHALLGARGAGTLSRHGPENPLPHDVIVIDEASMLGLELADALLAAVAPSARLIFAGDADQLSSVEPGNVFADLIAAGAGPLRNATLRLTRNYRQSDHPEITGLASAVLAGDLGYLESPGVATLPAERPNVMIDRAVSRYRLLLGDDATLTDRPWQSAVGLLQKLAAYRMLTALRTSAWGSHSLAIEIDRRLSGRDRSVGRSEWYNGRLVTLTRNLRALGLANGDLGLAWFSGATAGVVFEMPQGPQWLPVSQLPGLEPAWCQTVHKSQGSEFDEVDLLLAPPGHALARRELVYTGVTRARRKVTLWGDPAALAAAMTSPMQRRASLYARIMRNV